MREVTSYFFNAKQCSIFFAVHSTTRYLHIYVTNSRLPNGTVIDSTEDLQTYGITDTDLCGRVDRVFTQAEIATVQCQMGGRYVLIHQYEGSKIILCEVIVLGNKVSGTL